ncbi:MAG TPA: hypothetical protein DDY88_08655 [Actinobacteria bacterium]|nr:hypothetical protein [Actinomycetota bacterium]
MHRFSWTFSDPDPGDTQSAFDLRYRVIAAGSWTDLSATTVNTYVDIVGSAFTANNFEWQVRTYDALGAVGSYSASSFFTAASTPATPTITAPADGATVTNNQNVTWSAPSQTAYQLRRIGDSSGLPDTGTIYSDTGEVTDAVARALSVDFPVNNRFEHVQVRVKNAGLWSAWASARVSVSFTSPSPATFTVTADNATASILVTITNPVSVPAAASNAVYVREASDTGYGQRMANGLLPNTAWTWRTPASGVEYEFRVLTTGATGTTIWSVLMITLIYDGGTPTTVYDLILDGGTPTTVYDRIIDGGIP